MARYCKSCDKRVWGGGRESVLVIPDCRYSGIPTPPHGFLPPTLLFRECSRESRFLGGSENGRATDAPRPCRAACSSCLARASEGSPSWESLYFLQAQAGKGKSSVRACVCPSVRPSGTLYIERFRRTDGRTDGRTHARTHAQTICLSQPGPAGSIRFCNSDTLL